jgi:hypothetical protein
VQRVGSTTRTCVNGLGERDFRDGRCTRGPECACAVENAYSIGSRRSNLARFQIEVLQSLRSKWAINYNCLSYRRVCRVTDGNHRVSRI